MSRNWLRQLGKRLFGGTSTARSARRKPTSVRLGVEALEDRLVPSGSQTVTDATGTTFWLNPTTHQVMQQVTSGFSFPTSISNVSSLVKDAAGDVFALRFDDHKVYEHIQRSQIWQDAGSPNTSSLVSDAAGDVFALTFTNHQVNELFQTTAKPAWWAPAITGISSLVSDGAGDVFALTDTESVFEVVRGTRPAVFGPASMNYSSSLVSDAAGDVFALNFNDHKVYEHVRGTRNWKSTNTASISSLVSDEVGDVFALRFDTHEVYKHTQGTLDWVFANESNTSSLVSDAAGNVFSLTFDDHQVHEDIATTSGSWFPAGGQDHVSSLVSDAAGDVFALRFDDHKVYEHGLNAQNWVYAGPQNTQNASRLVRDAAGDLFALRFDDQKVYEYIQGEFGLWNWTHAYNVSSLVTDAAGDVFALSFGNGHKVWMHTTGALNDIKGNVDAWVATTASDISSLVSERDGAVFALSSSTGGLGGNNQVYEYSWSRQDWQPAGFGNISSMVSDARGDVFVLRSDDVVYEHTIGGVWSYAHATKVTTLVSNGAGDVFDLTWGQDVNELTVGTNGWAWPSVGLGVTNLAVSGSGTLLEDKGGVLKFSETGRAGTWQASLYNNTTLGSFWVDFSGTVHAESSASPSGWVSSMTGESNSWAP